MIRGAWRDGDRVRAVEVTPLAAGRWRVAVDGVPLELGVERLEDDRFRLTGDHGETIAEISAAGTRRFVRLGTLDFVLDRETPGARSRGAGPGHGLESPMPGVVTRVLVAPGDAVTKGQPLVAVEAMKMEHLVRAPAEGRVRAVKVRAGEMVTGGVTLVELEDGA